MPGHLCLRNARCAVCHETLFGKKDDQGRVLSTSVTRCGHVYHQTCILSWMESLMKQHRKTECAVCRSEIERNRFGPVGQKWGFYEVFLEGEEVEDTEVKEVASLKKQLAEAQAKVAGLEKRVVRLEQDVVDREAVIGAMTKERLRLEREDGEMKMELFALRDKCSNKGASWYLPKAWLPASVFRAIIPLPKKTTGVVNHDDDKPRERPRVAKPTVITLKRARIEMETGGEGRKRSMAPEGRKSLGYESERVLKKARPNPAPMKRHTPPKDSWPRRPAWCVRSKEVYATKAVGFPVDFTLSNKVVGGGKAEVEVVAETTPEANNETR